MFKQETQQNKIVVLGIEFSSEEERREYFSKELRRKLPELKQMEGFPIGEDDDIVNLSDPPYYTACPNPWLNDFIAEWEEEKKQLEKEGKRSWDFHIDEPYASDVSEGKSEALYKAHNYHTKVPYRAILRYILHYTEPGDIIYDGFAGTGMVGVAAAKANKPNLDLKFEIESSESTKIKWGQRRTINNDLSPIASFIAYNYQMKTNLADYSKLANDLLKSFNAEFGWMYQTKHETGEFARIDYIVWSEVLVCSNCQNEFIFSELFYNPETQKVSKEASCLKCGALISKNNTEISFSTTIDPLLKEPKKNPKRVPHKIHYTFKGKKHIKTPDEYDMHILEEVEKLEYPKFPLLKFPEMQMMKVGRVKTTNISHLHHFYLKRAAISISYFWYKINEIKDTRMRNSLYFLFEQIIWGMSFLNRFTPTHFSQVNRYLSGVFYVASHISEVTPFYILEGKIKRLISAFSKHNFNSKSHLINTGDCSTIGIQENSVDYIFTDPPFGENIYYSDLNMLIEAWHQVITNSSSEAIVDKAKSKAFLEYQNLMYNCFKKYYSVLKPGKWMTVEFSNTSAAIWNGIQTAIQNAGFVISNVASLDKKQGTFQAVNSLTAVKQDLVISCYKPSSEFDKNFKQHQNTDVSIWAFIEEHLLHLPIHLIKENATTAIVERSPKILFDRLIAFYVQKGLPVPIDAGKFQEGLRERFIERDGMFFTSEQVQKYDKKKEEAPTFIQLSLLVSSEQDGVYWLKSLLKEKSLTYQDIQPQWMQALAGVRKGDIIPELADILEENFLKNEAGEWYLPDPENEADLEKLRNKRLLKQFETYKTQATAARSKKIKEVRVDALRVGFKQCYQEKDFSTIVTVGDKIPNNLLMEDEVLLQFYDIASTRV
ncbi:DNA methyltransferase [Maribellus mangrovi]|uniref:DNA methyltransferase n=1 Tax=Maribellus mangrovi TaxID=3133146 RepID=UPI0030EEBBAA